MAPEFASTERDDVLESLAAVTDALAASTDQIAAAIAGAEIIRAERAAGASYSAILADRQGPQVVESITSVLDALSDAASRLRRAEVRALYADGLSMDKIGRLLGVSRQRVSSLLQSSTHGDGRTRSRGPRHRRGRGLAFTDADLRMIAELLPHIVWIAAPDGETLYVNGQCARYTGLPREANYDWSWVALVHPDDAERARTAWQAATASETPFELDYRIRRADGQFRWHSFRARPIRGDDGRVRKWIGTATDIDDSKRLEQVLREQGSPSP